MDDDAGESVARALLASSEKELAWFCDTTPISWENAPAGWKSALLEEARAIIAGEARSRDTNDG